jgi:uncharacterized membrane protein
LRTSLAAGGRIDAVDVARGVAIAAMIVFHTAWDLSFLRLIATPVGTDPAWQAFAQAIAGSFLALVGVGLVLGHGDGIRWRAFAKRLAVVAAAAALVTAATLAAFPDSFIFFGILHMIALGSVLALPFLRAPLVMVAGTAAVVVVLPTLVRFPALNGRALGWIGLAEAVPPTNDFEPIFPWLAPVLAGIVLARLALASRWRKRLASWRAAGPVSRALAAAGRRSLVIYLLHQPVLLGVLYPLAQILGPNPAAEAAGFLRGCAATCRDGGRAEATCRAACACVLERAERAGLRRGLVTDALAPEELRSVRETAAACFLEADGR